MLRWRAATALVLAPIALASIALGKWAVLAVLLVVIAGAAYELSRALEPLPVHEGATRGAQVLHPGPALAPGQHGMPGAHLVLGQPEVAVDRAADELAVPTQQQPQPGGGSGAQPDQGGQGRGIGHHRALPPVRTAGAPVGQKTRNRPR